MRRLVLAVAMFVSGCGGCGGSSVHPDGGMPDGGAIEVVCATLPPATTGTCDVTTGGATFLIEGTVLTPTTVYRGGQVAVDAT